MPFQMDASVRDQAFWCIFYGAGVVGALIVYGVLQERIMTVPYDGERFSYSVLLVLLNKIAACLFAVVMAVARSESLEQKAPLWKYAVVSLSNVFASTCQYECLKYVSFPVQVLGKSFKMMPVMFWGIAISGKRYGLTDWAVAACVTGGVMEFLMTGPVSDHGGHADNPAMGFVLLLLFLGLDGLTSTMQEKLFKEHATSKYNQMLYINSISSCVSLASMILTGSLLPSVAFLANHGGLATDAAVLSLSAVAGQFFIYSQVKEFGALVFAATMNVRQLASILVSYATYGHHLAALQVVGLAVVFSALFYKSFQGLLHGGTKAEKQPLVPKESSAALDGGSPAPSRLPADV